ncbi:MAG: phenylalanine--tRNA ligase subunit beta [Elusimicrobiota bacterium]
MKVSHSWLSEFLPVPVSPDELLRLFPSLGFDVDSVETLGPAFSGVVIGHVLEVQKHPNADRLSLCKVSDGKETFPVVCGAPNVAAGQRVPFALPGAKLPGGLVIAKTKIRGSESMGMLCSVSELGLSGDAAGILVLGADAPVGSDAAPLLAEKDTVLEVEVTANRPDCLSIVGLARELSIHLRKAPRVPELPALKEDAALKTRPVEIREAALCRRYIGREFAGLRVGPSPGWLARRLEAVGQRPINALVDVTNYVLFEYGHPLHTFDAALLKGPVVVRRAKAGEGLKALDAKTYALTPEDLVIADDTGPVAIAGVMGGESTGVTAKTTACFLESAHFKPGSVRATSRRLGLRSESSYRFERGTDPETAARASARASELILRLCRGTAAPAVDAYPGRAELPAVRVTTAALDRVLGTKLSDAELKPVLGALAARLEEKDGGWLLHPPSWRPDLATLADVAEEVARHIGYEAIPDEPGPARLPCPQTHPVVAAAGLARRRLEGQAFHEVCTLDLVSEKVLAWTETPGPRRGDPTAPRGTGREEHDRGLPAALANPLSDDAAWLRTSLWPGLLQSALYNASRGVQNMRLFEVGRVYALREDGKGVAERTLVSGLLLGDMPLRPHWREKPRPTDFHDAKGALEDLLAGLGCADALVPCEGGSVFHPKACVGLVHDGRVAAQAGLLDPRLLAALELGGRPAAGFTLDLDALALRRRAHGRMDAISPYPTVVRDLSALFPKASPWGEISRALRAAPALQDVQIELLDVFTGKGIDASEKSLTLRFTFSKLDRTLTDEEVNASMEKIIAILQGSFSARLRS